MEEVEIFYPLNLYRGNYYMVEKSRIFGFYAYDFSVYLSYNVYFTFFAACSILYPGLGSFDNFRARANRSKQFPTAISIVSPNIRYLFSEYAMICVLPPLTYNTVGLSAPVE